MRANKLTNSIYSILNEDKFSKYTVKQIYDELGKEEFVEYVDKICLKIIKGLKKEFDGVVSQFHHSTGVAFTSIEYFIPNDTDGKHFKIIFYIINDSLELSIIYIPRRKPGASFGQKSIEGDETDMTEKLKSAIYSCYQLKWSK